MPKKSQPGSEREQPVYWFVLLEYARERGDQPGIQRAKLELQRLGVFVEFGQRQGSIAHAV